MPATPSLSLRKLKLRLVTYNVNRFKGIKNLEPFETIRLVAKNLAATLSDYPPSVLALNEVDLRIGIHNTSSSSSSSSSQTCLDHLAQSLEEEYKSIFNQQQQQLKQEQIQQYQVQQVSCIPTHSVSKVPEYHVFFFGHVGDGKYGNALLANKEVFKISEQSKSKQFEQFDFHLPGGTKIQIPEGTKKFDGTLAGKNETHQIKRGMMGVKLELKTTEQQLEQDHDSEQKSNSNNDICFFTTHLDHISQDERLVQLSYDPDSDNDSQQQYSGKKGIVQCIKETSTNAILLGDLNSLTRSDYNEEEWQTLENCNKDHGWKAPEAGCLDETVLSNNGLDFIDLFAESKSKSLSDLPPSEKFSAHDLYRIDYILASKSLMISSSTNPNNDNWKVGEAKVLNDINCSDHKPVYVDLELYDGLTDGSGAKL